MSTSSMLNVLLPFRGGVTARTSRGTGTLHPNRALPRMLQSAILTMVHFGLFSVFGLSASVGLAAIDAIDDSGTYEPKVPVGISGRIEQVVIPGGLLEERAIDGSKTPVVLRIEASYPHGSAHRYDLVYYGLEPGTYNLIDFLQYPDGKPFEGDDSIEVVVYPVLPPDVVKPNEIEIHKTGRFGGYRTLAIVAGVFWVIGLVLILTVGRGTAGQKQEQTGPATLADRLRPMIESASQGSATHRELADLERILVAYWRRKLGFDSLPSAQAIGKLREHPDSGPLLMELESWLHRPGGAANCDVETLLAPYRDLAADELESGGIG